METYIDWMKSCYFISVLGLPAVSVPCGFTAGGLPVGLQIVGRHQDDFGVLQLSYAFQEATECWKRKPEIARRKGAKYLIVLSHCEGRGDCVKWDGTL